MAEDFEFFGMDDEASGYAKQPTMDYQVWQENILTVQLFVALGSQWRVIAGMAGIVYQGLNYEAVQSTLSMMGIKRKKWPELLDGLQVMEAAALKVMNNKEE